MGLGDKLNGIAFRTSVAATLLGGATWITGVVLHNNLKSYIPNTEDPIVQKYQRLSDLESEISSISRSTPNKFSEGPLDELKDLSPIATGYFIDALQRMENQDYCKENLIKLIEEEKTKLEDIKVVKEYSVDLKESDLITEPARSYGMKFTLGGLAATLLSALIYGIVHRDEF